ncbi:MAG TPA: DinB family protein [Candidatus Krumholzibacteria bacterium]|nr:DinB family protein [Candidatus Krumholzibacteria bacterium]
MQDILQRWVDHMGWADAQILAKLRSAPEDTESLKWYAHVLAAERVWYMRLIGQDWTTQRVWPSLSLDECAALAEQNAAQLAQFVTRMNDDDIKRPVKYTNSAGETFENSVPDIVSQIVLHGVHHRGQIAASLRSNGVDPPSLDYIRFVRGK